MRLSDFIIAHTDEILKEWEAFAKTLLPAASEMSRLGLGLHIARAVAVAHDGTISVASTSKNGTVFTVRLPRA